MKKRLTILLAAALCAALLASCAGGEAENSDPPAARTESPAPAAQSDPPAETAAPATDTPDGQEPDGDEEYKFEGPGIIEPVGDVPDAYKEPAEQQGTVEQVTYHNGTEDKSFYIYLPYGYETSGQSYNVLYVMHGGGGGNPGTFLKTEEQTNLQKTVDNMIQNGEAEPFILVAPTWKGSAFDSSAGDDYTQSLDMVREFAQNELAEYVIPAVDGKYRTNASRDGRAFSGFSMGGVTTWFTFLYDLDCFRYFIPMSGDCWAVGQTGGAEKPAETVAALEEAVSEQGYTGEDFTIYAFTGRGDYALPNMAPQIFAMQESSLFVFGENTYFGLHASAPHGDPWARTYLYYVLPLLWQD